MGLGLSLQHHQPEYVLSSMCHGQMVKNNGKRSNSVTQYSSLFPALGGNQGSILPGPEVEIWSALFLCQVHTRSGRMIVAIAMLRTLIVKPRVSG